MDKKREVYQLIEKIRKNSGSPLQYNGYGLERRALQDRIGTKLESKVFEIYWNKEEWKDNKLDEAKLQLNSILSEVKHKVPGG